MVIFSLKYSWTIVFYCLLSPLKQARVNAALASLKHLSFERNILKQLMEYSVFLTDTKSLERDF